MHTFTVDVGVADATVPPVIDVPPVIEPVPTEPPVIDETPTTPVRETFKIDPKESWDVYDEKGTHVSFHNNMSNAIQKITNAGLAGVHGYTAVGRVTVDVTRKVTTERQ
ncbi:MAG: hypothetical protein O2856_04000 [Planctomycetota bacterium]|nr:hypothetical protein [Planctomycetota bacterium]